MKKQSVFLSDRDRMPNACGNALQTGLMQFSREDAVYLTHFDSLCQFLSVSLSGLFRLS
jgi:hypothetical protein